jgi:hypothetical protein
MFAKLFEDGLKARHFLGVRLASHGVPAGGRTFEASKLQAA